MNSIQLPDAEELFNSLVKKIQLDMPKDFALVGIRTGGVWLAERLHRELAITQPLGMLDVSFYRDDFNKIGLHAQVKRSEIPFDVDDTHILLVDDVLQTGRTTRAAINELFDYGRPASISLATLIDRGGRELPIAAQYVGTALVLPAEKKLGLQCASDGKLSLSLYDKSPPA
jgi:pyrimidine operon attenuation protein / uracil phosphoribosyltransferase